MSGSRIPEWQSGNLEIQFPFRDSILAGTSPVPTDLILDLRLFLSGSTEVEIYLKTLAYDDAEDSYTISFASIADGTVLLSGTIPRLPLEAGSRVGRKQMISQGVKVALFTPGAKWDTPDWNGAGAWTKNWLSSESAIESSLVNPGPQTFRRIFIADLDIPAPEDWPYGGIQTLVAGYNMEFGTGGRRVPIFNNGNPRLSDVIELKCGPGLGAGFPPAEDPSINYVATFNGVGPNTRGNVTISPQDCLRIFRPRTEDAILEHRLQFGSDCQPCCPCGNYLNTSRAIGRRSAKLKDLCNSLTAQLAASELVYNNAVSEINSRRFPMVVVRNVRALGSHVSFTVQNMTDLPIYAYVAFDVTLNGDTFGAPVSTQPNVVEVTQSGGADISLIIDAHRATLPALPFNETENPATAFAEGVFTLEYGQILVAVGEQTMTSPFSPISPGGMVEVVLNYPTIETLLAASTDPAYIRSTSVAGHLPEFRFRSLAVFGSSHAYACAAEDYKVRIQEAPTEPDAFIDRCDTPFANDYITVQV